MKNILFCFLFGLVTIGCSQSKNVTPAQKQSFLTSYVNPFIGTGGHGHTYPGATMPFGMVQLSPDTRLDGWDGCSGYHYSDSYIYGFSHTHLSGTGVSDYGDVLLMPTNRMIWNNGADGKAGYRAHFQHSKEAAAPGYYEVTLDSTNIHVALTVTERAGMHTYTYPSAEDQWIILDLQHRDKLLASNIIAQPSNSLRGYRHSKAWAENQQLWFDIEFSHPFEPANLLVDTNKRPVKAALKFINPNNEPVTVRVGISAVDADGAKKNRVAELGEKTFQQVKDEANDAWERQLEKIRIEATDEDAKVNFYTALYHSMLAPNLYQDIDGRYRGMDLAIHHTNDFRYYTVFSLWDTYRAAHPLYTILEPERTSDFINTMLAKYDEGGILPIWDLSANYTGCMIGYHGVSVIADAYLKGIGGFDANKAFEAVQHSAMQNHLGLAAYKNIGFIPMEAESESVSKTLEYAYDDWTIAQMAKKLGKSEVYSMYLQRAQSYKNLFNPSTNFFQGRFNNTWFGPFDPFEVNFNYTEANAWQYSLYAPHDISGLIGLMGGKVAFEKHLDQLFSATTETSGRNQADITGLIGQYAHGNEPSHHIAYLYNFVNKPHKTQELIRTILTELYTNTPDGISGNEDCGQMSAWYIFSALGFYPVTPGSNQYIIGAPLVQKAIIQLESGNTFTMVANGVSENHKYIKQAELNGKPLTRTYLYHDEIMSGGRLVFEMTDSPSAWGTKDTSIPITEIAEQLIMTPPFIEQGDVTFKNSTTVVLKNLQPDATIFYSLNDEPFGKYTGPLLLSESTKLRTYSQNGKKKSHVLSTDFHKIDPTLSISLATKYANEYSAGGDDALIDGVRGATDFRTGAWQGYWGVDLVATIDRSAEKSLANVSINFLRDQGSWIFYPKEVQLYVAGNDKNFRLLETIPIAAGQKFDAPEVLRTKNTKTATSVRYLKVVAKTFGPLPAWHLGYPEGNAWIFVDEIEIN